MEDSKLLQMFDRLSESMNQIHRSIDGIHSRLEQIDVRLNCLEQMDERLEGLEHGQTAIRRDVARVDRKIDRLSIDLGEILPNITDNASLKEAK